VQTWFVKISRIEVRRFRQHWLTASPASVEYNVRLCSHLGHAHAFEITLENLCCNAEHEPAIVVVSGKPGAGLSCR